MECECLCRSGPVSLSSNKDLPDVLYIPTISRNLLSIGKLTDQGHTVMFDSKHCYVVNNHNQPVFLQGVQDPITKVYKLSLPRRADVSTHCHLVESSISLAHRWHLRLCHPNHQRLQQMTRDNLVQGIPRLPLLQHICEICVKGKQTRHPIPKTASTRSTRPLQLIHSDLCGPLPTPSLFQSRYFITFTDDYSRYSWVYFLTYKSQALDKFRIFKSQVENTMRHKIAALQSDRGGEYTSQLFSDFCQQHGITRQLTVAKTPHQNGVSERKNRTLLTIVRTLAISSKAPAYLWEEFLRTANYITNRLSTRALSSSTPFECLTTFKPHLGHLRIIGSTAYVHIPKDMRNKLEAKSFTTVLVGYDDHSKAYRCYHPDTRKILISRDVIIDESTMGSFSTKTAAPSLSILDILSTDDTVSASTLSSSVPSSTSQQQLTTTSSPPQQQPTATSSLSPQLPKTSIVAPLPLPLSPIQPDHNHYYISLRRPIYIRRRSH